MAGASIPFALNNANKRSAVLDPADAADRDRFIDLAAAADIVVDSGNPGRTAAFGRSCAELSQQYPHLVAMSITDFGADGPRASWRATDPVLYAMSTVLSRSGPTTGRPVLPPNGIASATAAVQAAWATLVAYYNRLRYGTGDYIDFSRFEAACSRSIHHSDRRGRPQSARNGPTNCGVAGPETSRSTRPSSVATATSGSACCRHANGGECEPGWGSRSSSRTRSSTRSPRATARLGIRRTIAELFAAQTMDELVAAGRRAAYRSPRCSARQRRWAPSTSGPSAPTEPPRTGPRRPRAGRPLRRRRAPCRILRRRRRGRR